MKTVEQKTLDFIHFFETQKNKGIIRYCIYFTVISYLASILSFLLIPIDESIPARKHVFYVVVFVLPIIETLVFQALPFSIAGLLRFNTFFKVLMMTIPFAALHYPNGLISIVSAFFAGIIFSASFIVWEKKSYKHALAVVMAIHILHNMAISGMVPVLRYLLYLLGNESH